MCLAQVKAVEYTIEAEKWSESVATIFDLYNVLILRRRDIPHPCTQWYPPFMHPKTSPILPPRDISVLDVEEYSPFDMEVYYNAALWW